MIFNKKTGTSAQEIIFIKRAIEKLKSAMSNFQEKLTAGTGIQISEQNVISGKPATSSTIGMVYASGSEGISVDANGKISVARADTSQVQSKSSQYAPLVPVLIDRVLVAGIAYNALVLTDTEKASAQAWLGLTGKMLPEFPETSGRF